MEAIQTKERSLLEMKAKHVGKPRIFESEKHENVLQADLMRRT